MLKVARDLQAAYSNRFYVHKGMEQRVERGDLGANRKREGLSTPDTLTNINRKLVDRLSLKAFVEACLVLEEGVAGSATSTSG